MAAKGSFQLSDPENVDMTLTITMSLREWKAIKDQISNRTTAEWHLNNAISGMIEKANKEFNFYESNPNGGNSG